MSWRITDGTNEYRPINISISKQIDGLNSADITIPNDLDIGTSLKIFFRDILIFSGVITKKEVADGGEYHYHLVEDAIELQNLVVTDSSGNYSFTVENKTVDEIVDLILSGSDWTRISSDTTTLQVVSFSYTDKLHALFRVLKDYAGHHVWFGEGQVSASDTIGTGDGSTTSFSATLSHPPLSNTLTITYTIGGTAYTATDDGSGNISGTDVSGTVDYSTGSVSLTFTTAPDASTNISATYQYSVTKGVYFGSSRSSVGTIDVIEKTINVDSENRQVNRVIVIGSSDSVVGEYDDGNGDKTVIYRYSEATTSDECNTVAEKIYNILKNLYNRIDVTTKISAIEPGDTVTVDGTDYVVYQIDIDPYLMTLHLNAKVKTLLEVFGDKLTKYQGSVKAGKFTNHPTQGTWMLFGKNMPCEYSFYVENTSDVEKYTLNIKLDQYKKFYEVADNTSNLSVDSNLTQLLADYGDATAVTPSGYYKVFFTDDPDIDLTIYTADTDDNGNVTTPGQLSASANISYTPSTYPHSYLLFRINILRAKITVKWFASTTKRLTINLEVIVTDSNGNICGYSDSSILDTLTSLIGTDNSSLFDVISIELPVGYYLTKSNVVDNPVSFNISVKLYFEQITDENDTSYGTLMYTIGSACIEVIPSGFVPIVTSDPGHAHPTTDPGHTHNLNGEPSLLDSYPSNVDVYVNGNLVGTIAGGSATEVSYDITSYLQNGENTVELKPHDTTSTPGSIYIYSDITSIVYS